MLENLFDENFRRCCNLEWRELLKDLPHLLTPVLDDLARNLILLKRDSTLQVLITNQGVDFILILLVFLVL